MAASLSYNVAVKMLFPTMISMLFILFSSSVAAGGSDVVSDCVSDLVSCGSVGFGSDRVSCVSVGFGSGWGVCGSVGVVSGGGFVSESAAAVLSSGGSVTGGASWLSETAVFCGDAIIGVLSGLAVSVAVLSAGVSKSNSAELLSVSAVTFAPSSSCFVGNCAAVSYIGVVEPEREVSASCACGTFDTFDILGVLALQAETENIMAIICIKTAIFSLCLTPYTQLLSETQ